MLTEGLRRRLAEAEGCCVVDYGFHVDPTRAPAELLDEIRGLAREGSPSFKFFMNYKGYALPDERCTTAPWTVAKDRGLTISSLQVRRTRLVSGRAAFAKTKDNDSTGAASVRLRPARP